MLWLICAKRQFNGPRRAYFLFEPSADLIALAESYDCDVRVVKRDFADTPHCNKILPFLDPDGFENQIVTDTDVFLTSDLSDLFSDDVVRLAPNNHGNPPLATFRSLFHAAGLPHIPEPGLSLFSGANGRETYAGNVSAGVICIPKMHREFAQHWYQRAKWLCSNTDLLGRYRVHVDQVSFALAAAETKLPFLHLPAQANAILELLPQIDTLYALHITSGHIPKYPDWFDADKRLNVPGVKAGLEPSLMSFNEAVGIALDEMQRLHSVSEFKSNFLNPAFKR